MIIDVSVFKTHHLSSFLFFELLFGHVLVLDIIIKLFHVIFSLEVSVVSADDDVWATSFDPFHVIIHVSLVLHPPLVTLQTTLEAGFGLRLELFL